MTDARLSGVCSTKAPECTKLTTCQDWLRSSDSSRLPFAHSQRVMPQRGLLKSQFVVTPGMLPEAALMAGSIESFMSVVLLFRISTVGPLRGSHHEREMSGR